ncbi:Uncharacterized protein SCF082_LOCUS31365, partial [Durusdinium trenchii]
MQALKGSVKDYALRFKGENPLNNSEILVVDFYSVQVSADGDLNMISDEISVAAFSGTAQSNSAIGTSGKTFDWISAEPSMKLLDKLSIFKSHRHEAEIGGQNFVFHPISLPVLYQLQSAFKGLGQAFASFASAKQDVTHTEESTHDPATGQVVVTRHNGAIDPELAKIRVEQRQAALQATIDAMFADENMLMVGRVIGDSLKAEDMKSDAEIRQFLDNVDLTVLIEFCQGVVMANAKVFGPFLDRLKAQVKAKLEEALGTKESEESGEADGEATPEASDEPDMEDRVVSLLLATGWRLEYVLSLDVLTFSALEAGVTRVQYQDKIESTRLAVLTGNAAFSGKLEAVDKVTDAWAKAIGAESAPLKDRFTGPIRKFREELLKAQNTIQFVRDSSQGFRSLSRDIGNARREVRGLRQDQQRAARSSQQTVSFDRERARAIQEGARRQRE